MLAECLQAAASLHQPLNVSPASVSYIEAQNDWEKFGDGAQYRRELADVLSSGTLAKVERAGDQEVRPLLDSVFRPLVAARAELKPQVGVTPKRSRLFAARLTPRQ
jgi:hypothetical protein